jgi:hypothetical protein
MPKMAALGLSSLVASAGLAALPACAQVLDDGYWSEVIASSGNLAIDPKKPLFSQAGIALEPELSFDGSQSVSVTTAAGLAGNWSAYSSTRKGCPLKRDIAVSFMGNSDSSGVGSAFAPLLLPQHQAMNDPDLGTMLISSPGGQGANWQDSGVQYTFTGQSLRMRLEF